MRGCRRLGIHYRRTDALALERTSHVERRAIEDSSDAEVGATYANSGFDDESALGTKIVNSGRQIAYEGTVAAGAGQVHVAADAIFKVQLMIAERGAARTGVDAAHGGGIC